LFWTRIAPSLLVFFFFIFFRGDASFWSCDFSPGRPLNSQVSGSRDFQNLSPWPSYVLAYSARPFSQLRILTSSLPDQSFQLPLTPPPCGIPCAKGIVGLPPVDSIIFLLGTLRSTFGPLFFRKRIRHAVDRGQGCSALKKPLCACEYTPFLPPPFARLSDLPRIGAPPLPMVLPLPFFGPSIVVQHVHPRPVPRRF